MNDNFSIDLPQDLGEWGETMACDYLLEHGYNILERNYRNRFGEMDVIAKDGDYICFIEVKTRTADWQGHPLEAVTMSKRKKLIQVALAYLTEEDLMDEDARFDIVSIIPSAGSSGEIEVVKNAFEIEGFS